VVYVAFCSAVARYIYMKTFDSQSHVMDLDLVQKIDMGMGIVIILLLP